MNWTAFRCHGMLAIMAIPTMRCHGLQIIIMESRGIMDDRCVKGKWNLWKIGKASALTQIIASLARWPGYSGKSAGSYAGALRSIMFLHNSDPSWQNRILKTGRLVNAIVTIIISLCAKRAVLGKRSRIGREIHRIPPWMVPDTESGSGVGTLRFRFDSSRSASELRWQWKQRPSVKPRWASRSES